MIAFRPVWLVAACLVSVSGRDPLPAQDEPLPRRQPVLAMQAVPLPDHQVSFRHKGRELTRLHWGPELRRPYLFPLTDPAGHEITRLGDARDPVGHSHHNGFWMSHQDVDGVNFWEDPVRKGRGRQQVLGIQSWMDEAAACSCILGISWIAEGNAGQPDRPLLYERRRLEARAPDAAGAWLLVIDSEFTVPGPDPVTFRKSYFGLLGVRLVPSASVVPGGGRILNSGGGRDEAGTFRQPARWVDSSGPLTDTATGGIALFDHPSNPGHPQPCHTRDNGWAGIALSGHADIVVKPDEKLNMRYGVWTHPGVPGPAAVEAVWQTFAALPVAPMSVKP